MPLARVTREVWKRVFLWFVILILSCIILIAWSDYNYMNTQMQLIRANYIDDVLGHGYCDGDE